MSAAAVSPKTKRTESSKQKGPAGNPAPAGSGEEGDDEDDVRLDVAFIQGFAR